MDMDNQKQLVKILRDLASTCRDAEEGFNKAAKGVHNDEYRAMFDKLSVERAAFASEWDELLRQNGSQPGDQGHAGGPERAGWVELETRIRPKDDSEIVQQAAVGDERSLPHYEHALATAGSSDQVRSIAERQMASIRTSVEKLRSLQLQHQ
jgi:uncharacterized protein (TIGR02284 family)